MRRQRPPDGIGDHDLNVTGNRTQETPNVVLPVAASDDERKLRALCLGLA
jgi:hypothetical protein